MRTVLALLVVAVLAMGFFLVRNSRSRMAVGQTLARRGRSRGRSAIAAKMTFVVPGILAADVVRTVVARLGFATSAPSISEAMVLVDATNTQACFALANGIGRTWESQLIVRDEQGGTHGEYEVIRWTLVEGVTAGWLEAEATERRIGGILTSIGGTVKVTVSN